MWTYFILFLGITALLAVFFRRAILFYFKNSRLAADAANSAEKIAEESENLKTDSDIDEKILPEKKSKGNKFKIANLLAEADVLLKKGDEEDTLKVLIQALSIDNNHLETLQKLAMLYLQKQMLGAASALFKQLAELTDDPVHYSHLGLSLYQQSCLEEARDAYQKSVELDPSRPQRFVSLAQVYRSLDQPQNAVIALSKAIELDQENMDFLLLMAAVHSDLEKIDDARSFLKTVLEKDPEHQEALSLLKKLSKESADSDSKEN
ncbi:MAG: tetratricopeptide repeat protein [Candidatus Gracilibacteria bacterium]|nr:tetratricopeptide repeat protein [Candidatus Gracilibacteria bacterium]